jgi:multidrug efflux pump
MVGNAIIAQPGANNVEIADEFYRRLELIKRELPEDIRLGIGFDKTQYIRASIAEVQQSIYLAFGLVVLGHLPLPARLAHDHHPGVGHPISLIGTFFVMYLADFSINVLTLLGYSAGHRLGGR